ARAADLPGFHRRRSGEVADALRARAGLSARAAGECRVPDRTVADRGLLRRDAPRGRGRLSRRAGERSPPAPGRDPGPAPAQGPPPPLEAGGRPGLPAAAAPDRRAAPFRERATPA